MKNLEFLITEANSCKTIDDLIAFCREMIQLYTAGKQEQHLQMINAVEVRYRSGEGSQVYRETYARNRLMSLIGNVCLKEKVIR